jgi:hypothetical protein
VHLDDLVDVGHLQNSLDVAGRTCDAQLPSRIPHLPGGHDDNSNAGAVNMSHTTQVENDLLVVFLD